MSTGPRYRFAPSPTGFFHVGGARTALFNWALAKQTGGTFVLRIEDTDEARNRPEWTQGIIDSLAWIGISADDPQFEGPLFQSDYISSHLAAASRLFESGHAYYCDMTPDQIAERGKADGVTGYGGWSRDLGLGPGDGRVLRFRVPAGDTVVHDLVRGHVEFDNATIEDFVLVRSNGTPVFLLANVVDDVEMAISHVVRAEEHLPNTPKQQMIWEALAQQPPVWAHVPVLVNEQRKKLSKRRDKVALEQYRAEGYLAEAMVNYLMTLGWSPGDTEIVPWSYIQPRFRLEDVNKSPAFFDLKKLASFNGDYIRMLTVPELVEACEPWLPAEWDRATFAEIAPHIQQRMVTLADCTSVDWLFTSDPEIDQAAWDKAFATDFAAALLADLVAGYEQCDWNAESLKSVMDELSGRYAVKRNAQAGARVAITGRSAGPPLFEAMQVMGRDESLRRLRSALTRLA